METRLVLSPRKAGALSFLVLTLILIGLQKPLANEKRHIVKSGDTLWDLSEAYRQDPFQWPEIWKNNLHLRNPHLIFPGDTVHLNSSPGSVPLNRTLSMETQATEPPVQVSRTEPGTEPGPSRSKRVKNILPEIPMKAPFLLSKTENAEFFRNSAEISYETATGNDLVPLYTILELKWGKGNNLKTGDLCALYQFGRQVFSFGTRKKLGGLTRLKGFVQIKEIKGKTANASLISCFGTIPKSTRAVPYKPKDYPEVWGYIPYRDKSRSGQVIYIPDNQNAVLPYDYIIIDHGADTGFQWGDGVAVFNRDPITRKPTDKYLGSGVVIRLRRHSATVLLKKISPGKLNKGDFVIALHAAKTTG